jgi:hypothetical protein
VTLLLEFRAANYCGLSFTDRSKQMSDDAAAAAAPVAAPVAATEAPKLVPLFTLLGVVYDMPLELKLPAFTETVALDPAAPPAHLPACLRALAADHGLRVVTTQLNVFKEVLPKKFGFAEFTVVSAAGAAALPVPKADVVGAVAKWLSSECAAALLDVKCAALPADLLAALHASTLVSAVADPMKMLCFAGAELLGAAPLAAGPHEWRTAALGVQQLAWLRAQHPGFPETAGSDAVNAFFAEHLAAAVAAGAVTIVPM